MKINAWDRHKQLDLGPKTLRQKVKKIVPIVLEHGSSKFTGSQLYFEDGSTVCATDKAEVLQRGVNTTESVQAAEPEEPAEG